MLLVAREIEIKRLSKLYNSREAEFLVLYGRRRVGKTFLIREFFKEKKCQFFQSTGLQKGSLEKQLEHFSEALSKVFMEGILIKTPASWEEAFKILTQFIEKKPQKSKTIIFLDELPWMASRKSGLLQALDYYWNQHWSMNPKIVLVVCGSSASWLIKNIIYNKGGLHNRCTCEIRLAAFNLSETFLYLKSRGIKLNQQHVLELYMALGGIPYYLKYVEQGLTASENIQKILFDKDAPLKDEFKKLFRSLFRGAEAYIELIELISKKEGITRGQIESSSKLSQGGGRLTYRLKQLIQTNFIDSYISLDKERGEYYKVIDEFCLFYIFWMSSLYGKKLTQDHWLRQIQNPIYHVWAGYAFESICHKHAEKIITALGIKTAESISSWKLSSRKQQNNGAQIDLLIDRNDDAITIGEIKYTDKPFVIDKNYQEKLKKKIKIFKESTGTKKQVFLAIITANGLKSNTYSKEIVDGVVVGSDLFV